jgi:hypothetical protein
MEGKTMIGYITLIAILVLAIFGVSVLRRRRIRRDAGFPLSRRRGSLYYWCGLSRWYFLRRD